MVSTGIRIESGGRGGEPSRLIPGRRLPRTEAAQPVGDLCDLGIGFIRTAAHPAAERPERWHSRESGKHLVIADYVLETTATDKENIEHIIFDKPLQ